MSFQEVMLGQPRPASVRAVQLPRRQEFFPSPQDWRDEVIYFLLPDRFGDGNEAQRPLLDRRNLAGARPPEYSRFVPPDWRESVVTRQTVEDRMAVLERNGARLFVERLRLEWRPDAPVPEPSSLLVILSAFVGCFVLRARAAQV